MKKVLFLILIVCSIVLTSTIAFTLGWENIDPEEAYNMVIENSNVYILDVRTPEEWYWVGHPASNSCYGGSSGLDGKVVNISWEKYVTKKGSVSMVLNSSFITDVNEVFWNHPNTVIITMCRSGVRSVAAANALEAAGYKEINGYKIYNMSNGFEGKTDPSCGYRIVNGWKIEGLPYKFGSGGAYPD